MGVANAMEEQAAKRKRAENGGWQALPSIDSLFSDKDATILRALGTSGPPGLDQLFNARDIIQLQKSVRGTVILPTDSTYHRDRQMTLYSVQEFPQLIVFCDVFEDVR